MYGILRRPSMVAVAAASLALFALACRETSKPTNGIRVEAGIYPVFFLTEQIGGDRADVHNVTPAGVEPHDYQLSARDLAAIERARLLVLIGGGFEPWGDKVRQNVDPARTLVVAAAEGLATGRVIENGEIAVDPHVWLSPPLAKQMTNRIAAGFAQTDPDHRAEYQSHAESLNAQLDMLHDEYRRGLARCAARDIMTSHAAFGYLASTYGLNQVPIFGLAPDAEPSPRQLADVARFARTHHVTTIFFESLVSPKLSRTIAAEVGAKTMVLDPIEGLTSQQLSAGENYFTVMRQNLSTLATALQCT